MKPCEVFTSIFPYLISEEMKYYEIPTITASNP